MPITTKAGPMPTHQRLRTDDGEDVQDRREPSAELDEKPTVGVRQPRPTLRLAPQNNQLLPECCILRLKSPLRLKWRSQDAQRKEDQRYHAARIADSLTPPTRMGFSAHTGYGQEDGAVRSSRLFLSKIKPAPTDVPLRRGLSMERRWEALVIFKNIRTS